VLLKFCTILRKCGFHLNHCQSQPQFLYLTTCLFGRMMANFCINLSIVARENSRKIAGHRTVSGWSLTMPAGHRSTSYGARPGIGRCYHIQICMRYMWPRKRKILKNRPVPRRLSISPAMCKSLKSYDASFICDYRLTKKNALNFVISEYIRPNMYLGGRKTQSKQTHQNLRLKEWSCLCMSQTVNVIFLM